MRARERKRCSIFGSDETTDRPTDRPTDDDDPRRLRAIYSHPTSDGTHVSLARVKGAGLDGKASLPARTDLAADADAPEEVKALAAVAAMAMTARASFIFLFPSRFCDEYGIILVQLKNIW